MPTNVRELLAALRIVTVLCVCAVPGVSRSAPASTPAAKPTVEPTTPTVTTEPTPEPEPEPEPTALPATTPVEPSAPTPSIDAGAAAALQQDARGLRDELFKARARVSIVASRLFTTRIALQLRSNLERFYTVTDLTLRIDGAPVYVQDTGLPQAAGDLFDVFAAPGSHELSISAALVSRRDATYKLRIDHAITFAVEADARISTRLQLHEHGNMWRFGARGRGHSDVRIQLRARSKRTSKGKRAAPPAAGVKASVGTGGSK